MWLQSDPLGLNAAPAEGGDGHLGNNQRKRRGSEEQGAGYINLKRTKVRLLLAMTELIAAFDLWSISAHLLTGVSLTRFHVYLNYFMSKVGAVNTCCSQVASPQW